MSDRNALSVWFPRIEAAGLPVPRTTLVEMNEAALKGLGAIFYGKEPSDDYHAFIRSLEEAAIRDPHRIDEAFPFFLRSDYTSAKHEWSKSCFVTDIPAIETAVKSIAYFSMCVGCPLPVGSKWAVRELLPIMPVTWCPKFAGMPVNREFRFFADETGAKAYQAYWPEQALIDGGAPNRERWPDLWEMSPDEEAELRSLAERAATAAGPGAWSVDILETERGWFVTDMAAAENSYQSDQMRLLPPVLSPAQPSCSTQQRGKNSGNDDQTPLEEAGTTTPEIPADTPADVRTRVRQCIEMINVHCDRPIPHLQDYLEALILADRASLISTKDGRALKGEGRDEIATLSTQEAERLHEAWSDFEDSHDLVREGHRHIRYHQCREAFESAWPNAEKATANAAALLTARPVEEPGEVAHASAERTAGEVFAPLPGVVERHRLREKILVDEVEQLTSERNNALAAAKMLTKSLSSAQVALAETRERLEKVNAERSQLLGDLQLLRTEMATAVTDMQDRVETAEARIFFFETEARRYASNYPEGSDGRNTFVIFADMIAARAALSTQESSAPEASR